MFNVEIYFNSPNECRFVSFSSNGFNFATRNNCKVIQVGVFQKSVEKIVPVTKYYGYDTTLSNESSNVYQDSDYDDVVHAVNNLEFSPSQDVMNTSDLYLNCSKGRVVLKCPEEGWARYIKSVLPSNLRFGKVPGYNNFPPGDAFDGSSIAGTLTFEEINFNTDSGKSDGISMSIFVVEIIFNKERECKFVSFHSNGFDFTVRNKCCEITVAGFRNKIMETETYSEINDNTAQKMVEHALNNYKFSSVQSVLNTSDLNLLCPEGILVLKCPDEGWKDYILSILPFYRPFGQNPGNSFDRSG